MGNQYKVLSDRCELGIQGAVVSPSDMSDANLLALVEGGHLEPVKTTGKDKE